MSGFFSVPPRSLLDAYLELARQHNDPAASEWMRDHLRAKGYGIIEAVRIIYGSVPAGAFIADADTAIGLNHDRPMSAGFFSDMDTQAAA